MAADDTNGLCANLCTADDEGALERQTTFRKLIKKLATAKAEKTRKRKQQEQRLAQRDKLVSGDAVKRKKNTTKTC